jgi:hypothetical protein
MNGARDKVRTAVLTAAEAFSHKPAKRVLSYTAYTGEEIAYWGVNTICPSTRAFE